MVIRTQNLCVMEEKINLDAPAWGEDAPKDEVQTDSKASEVENKLEAEAKEIEQKLETQPPKEEEEPEEGKVPYRRFKKYVDRAKESEAKLLALADEIESLKKTRQTPVQETELPKEWVNLYGDSEASKEYYKAESSRREELLKAAEDRAYERLLQSTKAEAERVEANEAFLDEGLENLSETLGRDLTEDEEGAVLDLVEEFSAKDEDGNLVAVFPIDKAWEIYELKEKALKTSQTSKKANISSVISAKSKGGTAKNTPQEDFNPSWGALDRTIREKYGIQ